MTIPGKDPRLIPYGSTNLGMPLHLAEGLIVPIDRFFVRSNGPTPALDAAAFRLRLHGSVKRELSVSLADLRALPRRSVTAFVECAGNGRSRFEPVAEGTPWLNDAAGNAVWTGTSLRNALDLAGVSDEAVEIVAQGGDLPDMRRGLPVAVARDPDVLLAWEMNGEPLPPVHGGPLRLLTPRWGGIASTKWLVGLEAVDRPFVGPYQGDLYILRSAEGEPLLPVREMPVKSVIATPLAGAELAAGPVKVTGFAWSGYAAIASVEVSIDLGATWTPAEIIERAGPTSWVRFAFNWDAPRGPGTLMSRATDERGLIQPKTARWNEKGYQMNAIHRVDLQVV